MRVTARGSYDGTDGCGNQFLFEAAQFAEVVGEGEGARFAGAAVNRAEVIGAVGERVDLAAQTWQQRGDFGVFAGELFDDGPAGAFGNLEKLTEQSDEEPEIEQTAGGGEGGPEPTDEFGVAAHVAGLVGGVETVKGDVVRFQRGGCTDDFTRGGEGALLDDHREPEHEREFFRAAGAVVEKTLGERRGGDKKVGVVAIKRGLAGLVQEVKPMGVETFLGLEATQAVGERLGGEALRERGQDGAGEHAFEEDELLVVGAGEKLVVAQPHGGRERGVGRGVRERSERLGQERTRAVDDAELETCRVERVHELTAAGAGGSLRAGWLRWENQSR